MESSDWPKVLQFLIKTFNNELSNCNKDDIIKLCLEEDIRSVAQNFLDNIKKSNFKDSFSALQKKEEGNDKFKKKQYHESLSLYTKSIFLAAKDDDCLPLAYSNRALLLERMGYLLESIADIDMALACGYPKEKVETLLLRKAKCLVQLGDVEKAKNILTEVLQNTKKKEYYEVFEQELAKIKHMKSKKVLRSSELPKLVGGENKDFPFASKHLSVYYNKMKGKHVIATQDLNPGDVLFVEKPFAFVAREKVCHNCCEVTVAPIPCWNCTNAYYCSPKCRDEFEKSIHAFECGFTALFESIGIAHLCFRIIIRASLCLDELKKLINNISEPEYQNGSVVLRSKGYKDIYTLVHNFENYEAKELFQYGMTALLLALYMKKHIKYFPAVSDDKDLSFLTSVILRHILQTICNGFSISKLMHEFSENQCFSKYSNLSVGPAIFASASMLNHSCEPAVTYDYHQNYLIVRAIKFIKKNEEVFISYGADARVMKRSKRQEKLSKQFFFECSCHRCLQPVDIQEILNAHKCSKCKGPSIPTEENSLNTICLSCGQDSKLSLDIVKKSSKFHLLMKEGEVLSDKDVNLSLRKFVKAWQIGREIFYKFHPDLARATLKVSDSLLILRDFRRCILFSKCLTRMSEVRFGFLSFEFLSEMKKLADVITLYVINNENLPSAVVSEGLLYYKKVKRILSIIPEHNSFKDLEINISLLEMRLKIK